ncbi:hypothetical protein PILCRDRAFT_811124 [Piloderma croceum F 1598]|uniref:Arginyl-tRNA--protein transferase 1 n=1 Tax=Piloderma croceum (strain F 1598) TaxID=765440 RepID=A0A0C3BVW4_PILCF|nr:hypothetical protein PILCRDRAFT_811124 [Piloderma croceum F 1598]
MTSFISVVSPTGPGSSMCGYCGPPGGRSQSRSSHNTAGFVASQLSCEIYQKIIDRGWRRSGTYCYKPDLKRSCCPSYTIKLDILEFKPSKSQRKLINRWNRFVLRGNRIDDVTMDNADTSSKKGFSKAPPFSLVHSIHASESLFSDEKFARTFETTLERSVFTPEKYSLFERYQNEIHHDNDTTSSGFKRFLVESPLEYEPIPYTKRRPRHLPSHYGSYHQLYRVDGELIAMAVVDILPNCVSSVYFIYDKKWEKHSLGKLSALREACLANEMHDAGALGMNALYLAFYIHSCQKMRYKADYSPSYLVDPEEFTWHPMEACIPLLDKYRYACFTHPEHSLEGSRDPGPESGQPVPDDVLCEISIIDSMQDDGVVTVVPINSSTSWKRRDFREEVYSHINGLGVDLSKDIILSYSMII